MTIKKRTLIKSILLSAIVLVALLVSAWFFASYQLSRLDSYKELITTTAGKALQREVTYEKGEATLTIRAGLALQFTNVVIREKDRSADLLNIQTAFFRVDILPLLRNRLVLREVLLDHPRLSLKRDHTGYLNIADLLAKGQKPEMDLEFRKLTIEKGVVNLLNQAVNTEGLTTLITNLSCRIDPPRWEDKLSFQITATVGKEKNAGEIALAGTFRRAPSGKPLTQSSADISLRLKGMDISHYHPYLNNRVTFKQLAGRLDMETAFSGTLDSFTAKGNITVKDALVDYPQVFRGPLQPQTVHADYALTRNAGNLKLDIARLAIDRFEATGHFAIQEMDQTDPQLTATAVTSTFSLKEFQSYIPWGIIPGNVGRFIETHIKDGNFRLIEGKLGGRLCQIVNMEKQENAGVLSLRAEVNKGVFVVNKTTPVFQNVSGILELKNRQFSLKNMTGRFGVSPCTLEGDISDFALPQPAVYNAAMTIQPALSEILWLSGKEKFRNLSFNGNSTLELAGKGPAENFHISARWDLTNAAYAYPEIMEKPQGRPNRLTAEITLKKDAANVSSFNYDLPPVSVSGSALYRFAGKKPLSLSVQSQAFDIREVVPLLPALRAYDPAGKCSVAVTGRGDMSNPGSFRWKGNVSLSNVSLKPPDNLKSVKGLTGKIAFQGNRMETSRFNLRIGGSSLGGRCVIDDFRKAEVACQFDAALFRSADLGWQSPEGTINFHDVKGQIAVAGKHIRVDGLFLRLGKSSFNLSGDIRNFANPKIKLFLNSPYVNFADVARLTSLKSSPHRANSFSNMELAATIQVAEGIFQGIDFKKINAGLNFTGGILNIEALEAGIFEGKLTGKGKVVFHTDGLNHYEVNLSVDRISLEKFQEFLEMQDRTVTGSLSLTGDVTATGGDLDDFKKTATGTFQVRAEKGVLKKFSVLSKIFSLLNVFQLAKFQLPDMAKGGMPYNAITGSLSLHNGVFASEDFLIDSDAMQISTVGKVDLIKKELDNTVSVHPLNTVDKIVAKIPVAGWLLTDEKGYLITVHFKVDGKWDDPRVTPIPVRSLARGTLDIFRRLFQLPVKLITDTGEVILGH
ncbi:MAG: AsmA-like C-terminal domain-containing protein [Smithellaceae bacterium]